MSDNVLLNNNIFLATDDFDYVFDGSTSFDSSAINLTNSRFDDVSLINYSVFEMFSQFESK